MKTAGHNSRGKVGVEADKGLANDPAEADVSNGDGLVAAGHDVEAVDAVRGKHGDDVAWCVSTHIEKTGESKRATQANIQT